MNTSPGVPKALKFGGGGNNGSLLHLVRMAKTLQAQKEENPAVYTIATFSAFRFVTAYLRQVYDEGLAAVSPVYKDVVRNKLRKVFHDHHHMLDGLVQIERSHGLVSEDELPSFNERLVVEIDKGHQAIGHLSEQAERALERLFQAIERGGSDQRHSIKAELESFGERLATEGVVLPLLRSLPGLPVLRVPAFKFMRAGVCRDQKFTAPSILWEESYHEMRGQLTHIADNSGYRGSPIPQESIILVTEGFIALTPDGAVVTIGTDNSDQTNGLIAKASFDWYFDRLEMPPPIGLKPTSILFKQLDPSHLSPPPMTFDELRKRQRVLGSRLVSPDAINDAENYGMCIDVYDIEKGTVIRFENPVVETVAK